MLGHPKIVHGALLQARLDALRRANKRLVFTNGCYDLLHPGHLDLLCRARALGDALLVALNSDASVRRLGKGAERPLVPLAARAFMLAHLECVDLVTSFTEDTPLECLMAVRPAVLVKGGDWSPERIVGRDFVEANGGTVHSLPLLPGYSSTALLEKIRGTSCKP